MAHTFSCTTCAQPIAAASPRVHCLVCADYDLCASCALGERFAQGHATAHETQVFKRSGGGGAPPAPGFFSITPVLAHAEPSRALGNPQPLQATPEPAPAPSAPPAGWAPWFQPDSSPTPAYLALINDIFTLLDPTNLGNLVPETFSRFLDDMGYPAHENSWKAGLKASFGVTKEAAADKALKNVYDLFSIDHILLQRPRAAGAAARPASGLQRFLGAALAAPVAPAGPMPAITRAGFVEITRIEALADPSREWGNYSRLLQKYRLARCAGWGALPRSVLPAVPDAAMLQRIAGVTAFAQQQGQQQIEAARMAAQLQAQANQAAVDLLSDTRRVEYRYR